MELCESKLYFLLLFFFTLSPYNSIKWGNSQHCHINIACCASVQYLITDNKRVRNMLNMGRKICKQDIAHPGHGMNSLWLSKQSHSGFTLYYINKMGFHEFVLHFSLKASIQIHRFSNNIQESCHHLKWPSHDIQYRYSYFPGPTSVKCLNMLNTSTFKILTHYVCFHLNLISQYFFHCGLEYCTCSYCRPLAFHQNDMPSPSANCFW